MRKASDIFAEVLPHLSRGQPMHPRSKLIASLIVQRLARKLSPSEVETMDYLVAQETLANLEAYSPEIPEPAGVFGNRDAYAYRFDRAALATSINLKTLLTAARTFKRARSFNELEAVQTFVAERYSIDLSEEIPDPETTDKQALRVAREILEGLTASYPRAAE